MDSAEPAATEAKNKEFQAAVAAAGIKLGANVAKMEVREAESAFAQKRIRRQSPARHVPRQRQKRNKGDAKK